MGKVGAASLDLVSPAVTAALIIQFSGNYSRDLVKLVNFLYVGGCMVGVWVSFGARNVTLTFHQLRVLEQDLLNPFYRLLFSGAIIVILAALFSLEVILIGIDPLKTSHVNDGKFFSLVQEQYLESAGRYWLRGYWRSRRSFSKRLTNFDADR